MRCLVDAETNIKPAVLYRGVHWIPGDEMCAMEAVAFVAGEPWSDRPVCASEVIGTFLRSWNDGMSNVDRQLLVPYIQRLVGTRAGAKIEQARSWMCADWLVRVHTPTWLEAAGLTEQARALRALPEIAEATAERAALSVLVEARAQAHAARSAAWGAWGAWADTKDTAWEAVKGAAATAASWGAWAGAREAWTTARDAWATAMAGTGEAAKEAAAKEAAWEAAWEAAKDASGAAARSAAATGAAARNATRDAARDAAKATPPDKLAATKSVLLVSAFALLDKMIALTEAPNSR